MALNNLEFLHLLVVQSPVVYCLIVCSLCRRSASCWFVKLLLNESIALITNQHTVALVGYFLNAKLMDKSG